MGGISTPARYPVILVFTGIEGVEYGYRDQWLDDDNFEYWGEGQYDDMSFTGGNRAIRDHIPDGKDLYLFTSTRESGMYRFIDQMICGGYRFGRGLDKAEEERDEIIFQLIRLGAISNSGDEEVIDAPISNVLANASIEELRNRAIDDSADSREPLERKTAFRMRSAAIKRYARARAGGKCEGCGVMAPFMTVAGEPYLEVHHVRRLSDDGPDHPSFVVAICPTCHRRAHYATDSKAYNQHLTTVASGLEVLA
jgi:5-methylcytosine-specific restriction protein A